MGFVLVSSANSALQNLTARISKRAKFSILPGSQKDEERSEAERIIFLVNFEILLNQTVADNVPESGQIIAVLP